MEMSKVNTLIEKYNKVNSKKPNHSTFVHIDSVTYTDIIKVNCSECTMGQFKKSEMKFASLDNFVNYLLQKTVE